MYGITGDPEEVKKYFDELLKKHGLDTDKWRDHLNDLPKDQRQMVFTFDTGDVKDGFIIKFNYIFTAVEIEIKDEKIRKNIEEGNID